MKSAYFGNFAKALDRISRIPYNGSIVRKGGVPMVSSTYPVTSVLAGVYVRSAGA